MTAAEYQWCEAGGEPKRLNLLTPPGVRMTAGLDGVRFDCFCGESRFQLSAADATRLRDFLNDLYPPFPSAAILASGEGAPHPFAMVRSKILDEIAKDLLK